ncbi:unnamed protein product [Hermetia illucens]|uniref:Nose resistant-to-fluoxetine protein N-terminal domain-containing protein n=1 Tax=Hermetia illucens TaxID=343691 RepID=A0A7R8UCH4_HERIL|nr:O-acyltransferase like protein-like [Hermetia illucens]CAD7077419.1 unnamed protein product [Hermetia illucens]
MRSRNLVWTVVGLVSVIVCVASKQSCRTNNISETQLEAPKPNKSPPEIDHDDARISRSEQDTNITLEWDYIGPANETSTLTSDDLVEYIFFNTTPNIDNLLGSSAKESDTIRKLSDRFFNFTNVFDPACSAKVSTKCRQHAALYLNALKNFELWALQMYDSSAHFTSGILNGNVNQFGDFDQCLNVQGPLEDFKGQYCLAYLQPEVPPQYRRLKKIHNLVQSHNAFISDFHDPGHRIPRFSIINWAICAPASCSPADLEYSLKEFIENITTGSEISVQVRVDPQMCQLKDSPVDSGTRKAVIFFIAILSICCISTIYDMFSSETRQNEWFVAFSLRKNWRWLFSVEDNPNDIKTVHGIRFLNAMMLLFSHKSMAVFFNPYINRTQLSENLGKPWTVIGRAASLYTDPFLLFSGMLTAYSLIGRLQKGRPVNLKSEYVGRMLRIVPTLSALIIFCTYILPNMGSGPQWNLVVGHHSDLCKKYWWRNLLFIHNYFGFNNMCLTHTHHVGIDSQLFVLAPAAIVGLWKRPRFTFIVLAFLISATTAARFYTTVVNELSNYVYFGATVQRLFKTADYMYTLPLHRSSVYMLGILLGYTLRKWRHIKLSPNQLRVGWFLSTICFFGTIFGPAPMGDITYTYDPLHAGYYAAFAPITWCLIFMWMVFTSHIGYGSKICRMLSWPGFQVATKLSYAIYLTQFPVFFYNVGRRRHADFYNFFEIMLNTNEYFCIFVASVVLTLLFDAPFKNIKAILFKNEGALRKEKEHHVKNGEALKMD